MGLVLVAMTPALVLAGWASFGRVARLESVNYPEPRCVGGLTLVQGPRRVGHEVVVFDANDLCRQ